MKDSRIIRSAQELLFAVCALAVGFPAAAAAPTASSSVIDGKDEITLAGNTHPLATPAADQGLVSDEQQLGPMFMVLRRSPSQESALAAFNERQLDASSPDYHHWLQPEEFGLMYGPNDADVSAATGWLSAAGFQVHEVSAGRIAIEFYGTAAQVQNAFGVQMHRYLVDGASAIANDRDPRIPRSLSRIVAGVGGLNTFPLDDARPPSLNTAGRGESPDLSLHYDSYSWAFMTPFDFATVYNSLPLWKASKPILGSGVGIAIVGDNDVNLHDVTTFQSTFGLPVHAPAVRFVASNPGGSSEKSTVALEMASAAAPGADLILVVPEGGLTLTSVLSAVKYTVDKNLAPIVVFPYSDCERSLGSSNNALINSLWQQGKTLGMSIVVAAGDQGSAACNVSGGIDSSGGLDVNGFASSPFVTAVGGTDFAWQWGKNQYSTYWKAPSSPIQYESAKGYIPEVPWNATCSNELLLEGQDFLIWQPYHSTTTLTMCNLNYDNAYYYPLVHSIATGGGASSLYAKPDWQRGTGVPADEKRDLPDVSLFASGGWLDYQEFGFPVVPPTPIIPSTEILVCYSGGKPSHACTYDTYAEVAYQTYGGTGAAAAYWAGILALVVQKQGGERQGLVNPTLYNLFNEENLTKCNTSVAAAGNSCVFYDVSAPVTNGVACVAGSSAACYSGTFKTVGILDGYTAGVGYDQTTGVGSVNITNLVNKWPSK